jgi:hypothetical protein
VDAVAFGQLALAALLVLASVGASLAALLLPSVPWVQAHLRGLPYVLLGACGIAAALACLSLHLLAAGGRAGPTAEEKSPRRLGG